METIRIVVVDDHPVVRQGLRAALRVIPGLDVAGEAPDGREAVALVSSVQPDIVLMDLVMPVMDGVTATEAIKRADPHIRVIALTTFSEAELVLGALQAGADGFLLKDVEIGELSDVIRAVHSGRPYLHPEATRHLLNVTTRPRAVPSTSLTQREQTVLSLVAQGLTNREIADQLGIADKTVSVHVSNLLGKLGLASRTQAALYAAQLKMEVAD
ncbi:MAG: response regulator [Dehalococcoidia bacterium]